MHEAEVPPPGTIVTYCSTSVWRPFQRGVLAGGEIVDPATGEDWLPLFGADGMFTLIQVGDVVEADVSGIGQRPSPPQDPPVDPT